MAAHQDFFCNWIHTPVHPHLLQAGDDDGAGMPPQQQQRARALQAPEGSEDAFDESDEFEDYPTDDEDGEGAAVAAAIAAAIAAGRVSGSGRSSSERAPRAVPLHASGSGGGARDVDGAPAAAVFAALNEQFDALMDDQYDDDMMGDLEEDERTAGRAQVRGCA